PPLTHPPRPSPHLPRPPPHHPSLYSSFHCDTAHRDLHSFPTRRSSDLVPLRRLGAELEASPPRPDRGAHALRESLMACAPRSGRDRKSTRLNSSHLVISYAVFCLKKKKETNSIQLHVHYISLAPMRSPH